MDNNRKESAKASQDFLKVKKINILLTAHKEQWMTAAVKFGKAQQRRKSFL